MMKSIYALDNTENLLTPSLIFYEDLIRQNTRQMIRLAGQARTEDGPGPDGKMPAANEAEGVRRLWPHIKTHKSLDMTRLLMSYGIRQFKAATIAEAEMCCMAGADRVLLAYPLIGPNMERLLKLQLAYPSTILYGLEDDQEQFVLLSRTIGRMKKEGLVPLSFDLPVLIDVDLGQGRTGVPLSDLKAMVR
ncbi:MAG: alanine racemase, partial [Firmicutes bacterium]|nr:alanine racemase [Bacillota bacterium]